MRQAAVLHYYLANNSKALSASRQAQNIFTISSSHFNNDKYDKHLKQHVKLLGRAPHKLSCLSYLDFILQSWQGV
jgi:hypothetical protein